MNSTRRDFLKVTGLGLAGLYLESSFQSLYADGAAGPRPALADQVTAICARLAPGGWRDLFLKLTGGAIDLSAPNLARSLLQPIAAIDRRLPGFEEFASEGTRAIEPGNPAHSLLFHAFASPNVLQVEAGRPLTDFPTAAEIETVENYVYGANPPKLDDLRRRAGDAPLAVAVFCREYRSARNTVHRKHADLCFSRIGVARTGTVAARYDGPSRDFVALDESDPFVFRVLPARFSAYIAMRSRGSSDSFGPMRFEKGEDGDSSRDFWVPLHKLFAGSECLSGLDLELDYDAHFLNEKLRRLHIFMEEGGYGTEWKEADRENFPFKIRDGVIAAFASTGDYGPGLVEPKPHPLFEKAMYQGKPLGFEVSGKFTRGDGNLWFSTLQIVADAGDSAFKDDIAYMDGLNPTLGRTAPEYINARHEQMPDGTEKDLNEDPDLMTILKRGGYRAQHYIDFTGDGWVAVSCPQLASAIPDSIPAYAGVAPPDFFPGISQGELTDWWRNEAPAPIRAGVWCIQPLALSDLRMAANITLDAGFDINDDTVTAVVSLPGAGCDQQRPFIADDAPAFTRLPDGSNGVFDPGWDFSQDSVKTPNGSRLYLANYGLGTPFIEDAKLCAALGSFWPAVAPDATRVFPPRRYPQSRKSWPWPSIVPLTDEEVGSVPLESGVYLPWDGVRGPVVVDRGGRKLMRYPDINRVDYINLAGKMTASLTAKIDLAEYEARILATAAAYWAVGIHDNQYLRKENWLVGVDHKDALNAKLTRELALNRLELAKSKLAIASFRKVRGADAELADALGQTKLEPDPKGTYRIMLYSYGSQVVDPDDFHNVLVEILDPVVLFVGSRFVLLRHETGPWASQTVFAMS